MAAVVDQNVTFRLDSPAPPGLFVPKALLELYQSEIGPVAVMLWLNLRWMAVLGHTLPSSDWIPAVCDQMRTKPMQLLEAMDALLVYELLRVENGRDYVLQEPLDTDAFTERFGETVSTAERPAGEAEVVDEAEVAVRGSDEEQVADEAESRDVAESTDGADGHDADKHTGTMVTETAASADSSDHGLEGTAETRDASVARRIVWDDTEVQTTPPQASPEASSKLDAQDAQDAHEADLSAVMGMYHKKIGMIGPTQFEKLRWWVDEQSMGAEVIALAIEETAKNAEMPTIQYLESVLRNWHNAGVRTFSDLLKRQSLSRSLRHSALRDGGSGGREGRPHPEGRSGGELRERGARFEGMANASAYQEADPARLRRWKELYADEQ